MGEFGGGCIVITDAGIRSYSTQSLLEHAFSRIEGGPHEGVDGFVLTTKSADQGLSFWNNTDGFGALATATVFSEAEAARFDKPIADDEPEWLVLPAPMMP